MRFTRGTFPRLPGGFPVSGPIFKSGLTTNQLTVGSVTPIAVQPSLAPPGHTQLIEMRNSSTSGQIIRVGVTPAFTPTPSGLPLYPGDTLELTTSVPLSALANAAGALLDLQVFQT